MLNPGYKCEHKMQKYLNYSKLRKCFFFNTQEFVSKSKPSKLFWMFSKETQLDLNMKSTQPAESRVTDAKRPTSYWPPDQKDATLQSDKNFPGVTKFWDFLGL